MKTARSPLHFGALWWLIGAGGIVLVIALSLVRNAPQIPGDSSGGLGHILAYATLMAWFARLVRGGFGRTMIAISLVALGVGLEYAQDMTSYRTFDVGDMAADAIGVAVGWLASPPRVPDGIAGADGLLARLRGRLFRRNP